MPHSLQVGIVTETWLPEVNGVAMTLGRLVHGLTARGHQVQLIRPSQGGRDQPSCNGVFREHLTAGFSIPQYPGLRAGVASRTRLRRIWSEQRPEVLYIATEGPLGWTAARLAAEEGIPALSGFHTNFARYSRHYRLGWLEPMVNRYLRAFHRRTACTLVPTAELQRRLQAGGYGQVEVLSRGVDCSLYAPAHRSTELRASWGLGEQDLAVLYVGRLAAEKNLEDAIAAFEAIQREQASARFVLVGDGPLRATLVRQHPEYLFCGTRTGPPLAQHFASADLFLFPSRTETFGNVVLEAMASGLPVVAYDYAAAAMHLRESENGMPVALEDSAAFVRAALILARESSLRRQLGCRAAETACQLDWSVIINRFESLLDAHRVEEVVCS